MKELIYKIPFLLFLIFMLCFPSASLNGAKNGLLLWFNTILPTLLPFIVVSNLIVRLNITSILCRFLAPVLTKIFRVSRNGCYPILIGFLSGYPVGAKACSDLLIKGDIPEKEASFLLSFCNNASIMFITSFVAISNLRIPEFRYLLLFIIYGSAILSALTLRFADNIKNRGRLSCTSLNSVNSSSKLEPFRFSVIDESILDGFEIITKVGGYIILFSILSQIVLEFPLPFYKTRLFLVGLLEITTGVNSICHSHLALNTKIILTSAITAFGGLSSFAQTKSVTDPSGLSMKKYITAKLLSSLYAGFFAFLYVCFCR